MFLVSSICIFIEVSWPFLRVVIGVRLNQVIFFLKVEVKSRGHHIGISSLWSIVCAIFVYWSHVGTSHLFQMNFHRRIHTLIQDKIIAGYVGRNTYEHLRWYLYNPFIYFYYSQKFCFSPSNTSPPPITFQYIRALCFELPNLKLSNAFYRYMPPY